MASYVAFGSALSTICYLYPAIIFVFSAIASLVATCTLHELKDDLSQRPTRPSKYVVIVSFGLFLATYVAQLVLISIESFVTKAWTVEEHVIISRLSCFLIFGIQLSRLFDAERPSAVALWGSVGLALVFEVLITVWSTIGAPTEMSGLFAIADFSLSILRCTIFAALASCAALSWWAAATTAQTPEETESLLPKVDDPQTTGYGATTQQNDNDRNEGDDAEYSWERRRREARETMEKRLKQNGNWFQYVKGFMVSLNLPVYTTRLTK